MRHQYIKLKSTYIIGVSIKISIDEELKLPMASVKFSTAQLLPSPPQTSHSSYSPTQSSVSSQRPSASISPDSLLPKHSSISLQY